MNHARAPLAGVALLALQAVTATAAARDAAWSATGSYSEDAEQTVLGQAYRPRRHTLTLARTFDAATSALGQHEYRVLDLPRVNGAAADTNGHVHRLTFGWQREKAAWRLRLAGVFAVSSNALKHPGDLNLKDLQPDIAVERGVADAFRFGLRADDRFGRTLLYPGAAWRIAVPPRHEVRLGFPDSSWRWQWTERFASELALAPDGNVWRVRDPDLVRHSEVRFRSWLAGASLRWQPVPALHVEASVGRRFASRLRYLLRDGTTARVDAPGSNVFGLSLSARF